jgi:molybdopterin molybdotransferase
MPGSAFMILSFEQALSLTREKMAAAPRPGVQSLPLGSVNGRVLAEAVPADRDYPPFHRSTRDGYAVRSRDVRTLPATLICQGELRAGSHYEGAVGPGGCVAIMTGAPLPEGADAVVMLEHTERLGPTIKVLRAVSAGDNVVRRGSEARAGAPLLERGRRLRAGEVGLLAMAGFAHVPVYRQPSVAIIPTGDELVEVEAQPEWYQIRNSNAWSLAAQVESAGGVARAGGIAADEETALRRRIEEGLQADLLLLSGGVSMGRYDLVEKVLADLGAEFYFQSVALRPGKPLVFGKTGGKFFFGLPGNPVSTYVTFQVFVRPAIAALSGVGFEWPLFLRARLGQAVRVRTGLTTFMPARVEPGQTEPVVRLVSWQGSGDLAGLAQSNCFLVAHPQQDDLAEGDWVDVLPNFG